MKSKETLKGVTKLKDLQNNQYECCIKLIQESATQKERQYIDENSHIYKIAGGLSFIKNHFIDIIWESIELDGLSGNVLIKVEIIKNEKCIKTNQTEINIEKVVHTDEISKWVEPDLDDPSYSDILEVDREKSSFKVIGEPIESLFADI